MVCRRCGKENDPGNQFCGRCGLDLTPPPATTSDDNDVEVKYCYRHPKEATRLSCGKCERPICTRCAIIGPAGVRCPECGKLSVPISARGVAHDVKRSFSGIFRGSPYLLYFAILLLLSFGGSLIRGCNAASRHAPPIERDAPSEEAPR